MNLKSYPSSQFRTTVEVPSLTIRVGTDEAHSVCPFLVRAKFSWEPEIRANSWDEPDCDEWFAFDGLYCYSPETFFATKDGVIVSVKCSCDLLLLLDEQQLEYIEKIVMDEMRDEDEPDVDLYEPLLDYEYGI